MYGHPSRPAETIRIIGETTFRRQHRRFGILPEDRLRHMYVLGKTGTGKSTLLANLVHQDLARGAGLALLDPHGDLVERVLALTPSARRASVLLFAPEDEAHPVSFNVFRRGKRPAASPALLASELIAVFKKQWGSSWGPRLEHLLRNGILAVAERPEATLLLLYRFLTDKALRSRIIDTTADPVVKQFWTQEFPSYKESLQAEALAPVLNKLGAFVSTPVIRNIVGQVRSRVDLTALMDQEGVLLAKLSASAVGEDASHLLGGLLLSSIQLAAMRRARGGPPFFVYIDEFQHFVTDALATMLAEARKFGLGLVLAHQYLAQLPEPLRDAVLGNVGTTVVFRVGAEDAQALAPTLEPAFSAPDLVDLPNHHVAVKLLVRGEQPAAFSARTLPPPPAPSSEVAIANAVRAQSRSRFAAPRERVEDAIHRMFAS